MSLDVHIIIQSILYFVIFVINFVVAIPLGLLVGELNGQCALYTDFVRVDEKYYNIEMSSASHCNFVVYLTVVTMLYALVAGVVSVFVACRSKDSNVGDKMWLLTFLWVNSFIVVCTLVSCCMVSVGFTYTCNSFEKYAKSTSHDRKCPRIDVYFKGIDMYQHFYTYPTTTEIAGWIVFLLWLVQITLSVIRCVRYRRQGR